MSTRWALGVSLLLLGLATMEPFHFQNTAPHHHKSIAHHQHHDYPDLPLSIACPTQPDPLDVGPSWHPTSSERAILARRLSRAVQINTESRDDAPWDPTLPLWDNQRDFSDWLEAEFPSLFRPPIRHEYINTHGHLYTWPGSDLSLKPILLMAHVDTVPVSADTLEEWTFPPYDGHISRDATPDTQGEWIWGRGANDCKNSLLAMYNVIERLIDEGFQPRRTILVANGYDEEISGTRGAGAIARVLEDRYGTDSIAFVVDEGFTGLSQEYGATFASLGMAEKGALDLQIAVGAPGGHSSRPPRHTAIGVMSQVLAALESNPFAPTLDIRGPYVRYLSCLDAWAPEFPSAMRVRLRDMASWDDLASDLAASDVIVRSFLTTTQAVDIVRGGDKINALPEMVTALINYRISFTFSIAETIQHVRNIIEPVAHRLNYTLIPGEGSSASVPHSISIEPWGMDHLEPAPITSAADPSFALIAGTTKAVFGAEVIVTPTGMYANTDTAKMWNLSRNLYRFTPAMISDTPNQHTIDERISVDAHVNTTRFYYKLIRNADDWAF